MKKSDENERGRTLSTRLRSKMNSDLTVDSTKNRPNLKAKKLKLPLKMEVLKTKALKTEESTK